MSELINKAKENVPKVYESGRKIGHDEGVEEGYNNGLNTAIAAQEAFLTDKPQTYYDTFWDVYQENGEREDYSYAFLGKGWSDNNFNPKYDIVPTRASVMFQYTRITDLKGKLKAKGLTIDFSKCSTLLQVFQGAAIKHIPTVDARKATNTSYCFGSNAKIEIIDKFIVSENTVLGNTTFNTAYSLTHVIFEGVIASNNLNLHWSALLDKESIESVINCLSTTTTGLTVTLSQTAVNNAFTTEEWEALETTKSNWTISLV